MSLNDFQIKKLQPKKTRYEVNDGMGLKIRVDPSGSKSFIFRYMLNGKARRMLLGKYPTISLLEARARLKAERDKINENIDPLEARKKRDIFIFQDLFDEFWERELSKQKAGAERKRLLEKDILPVWSKSKVSSITRRDAVLLLDKVKDRAPVTANRLLGVLVRIFNFACERGVLDFSPLTGMKRGKEKARERVLSDVEIKALWESLSLECEEIDIYHLTKLALKSILLTGQRPGEVVSMEWSHLENEFWTNPANLRKNENENRTPILPMFADVLKQAKTYSSNTKYVFRSSQSSNKSLTVGALANAIRRHRAEMGISERFTPHDLRRTLRTKLAELGVNDVIAEQVLGHKLPGIVGVYNRYQYDAEKRIALGLWEKRLSEILNPEPTNIVSFQKVRNG
ncbi:MAG: tyrosine-type recombinase/integrase [Alphaproteobacteria bacterium]|nr:tyrosine-type recombinase/integrase [Alphaproteobacteria bacterium]